MNSYLIDIIFVAFLVIMTIFGYLKGFITRLYDFAGTLIVLFISYFLAKPLSSLFVVYKYDANDIIASMIGQVINQIIIFIILIIVLMIIKKIIGIFIKPTLKKIMDTFSLTSFVDKGLGVILSFVEGIIVTYLVVVFIFIPLTGNGYQLIQETILTKQVLKIVPNVSEQVIDLTQNFKDFDAQTQSAESLTKLLLLAKDLNLVDQQQVEKIFKENIENRLNQENFTLTSSQKQQIEEILNQSGYTKDQIQSILSNINVSDK